MKFTMKSPCDSCPFVRAHRFPLHPGRVREIEANVGAGFPCHQTVDYDSWDYDDDPDGLSRRKDHEVHCAGSLILQWKQYEGFDGFVTWAVQALHEKDGWTPDTHLDLSADTFDDFDEMYDAMVDLDSESI